MPFLWSPIQARLCTLFSIDGKHLQRSGPVDLHTQAHCTLHLAPYRSTLSWLQQSCRMPFLWSPIQARL